MEREAAVRDQEKSVQTFLSKTRKSSAYRKQNNMIDELCKEKEILEKRLEDILKEQDMLDQKSIKLFKEFKAQKDRAEKAELDRDLLQEQLKTAKSQIKSMKRVQYIQTEHKRTIKVGLQYLKDCLKKNKILGLLRCRKTASKIDVVNKLLAHIGYLMATNY